MNRLDKRMLAPFDGRSRPETTAALALLTGATYLTWRATTLGSGGLLGISVPLFVIELWAFGELALLAAQTWRLPPRTPRRGIGQPGGAVDVVIIAAGASADALERSLISCRSIRGRGELIVVDDQRRIRHRSLAAEAGASYRIDRRAASAPTLAAHRNTRADLYLWVLAGQLPTPDVLEVAAPQFARSDLAVCQLAVRVLNRDDLAHLGRERDDDALVNDVVGPALSRWGAGPWHGPASVVRRRALDAVGGVDPEVPIERLSARLHGAGWCTAFEGRQLVAVTVPESIDRYLAWRRRRAGAAFAVLGSTDGPLDPRNAMSRGQRLAHLAAAVRFATGLRLLVVAALVVVVVLGGRFPMAAPAGLAVAFWAVNGVGAASARRALARGSMGYGDWIRQGWRVLGAELSAVGDAITGRVGPTVIDREPDRAVGGWRSLLHLPVLDLVVLAVDLALLIRALSLFDRQLLPAFTTGQRVVAIGFAIGLLVPIVDVLQVIVLRRQRRTSYRVSAELDATLDGSPARTVDVTPEGAGIVLGYQPEIGSTASLELALPGADGVDRRIVGRALVRSVRPDGEARWRAGLELTQMAVPARQALVAFCAQAAEADETDEAMALDPVLATEHRRRRSMRRVTLGAGLAGLATMAFGPTVASASTATPHLVEQVCLVDADGGPVSGARVDRLVAGGSGGADNPVATVVGATGSTGCVQVGAVAETIGFELDHRGQAYRLEADDYRGTEAVVALVEWPILVVDLDGRPAAGVGVRVFTDRWLDVGPAEPDGRHRFLGLPVEAASLSIEIAIGPNRHVRPVGDDGIVVLSRVRLDAEAGQGGEPTVWLDRGRGWEPAVDGADLVPGRLAIRTTDGPIVRLEVPESSELRLPAGEVVAFEVDRTVIEPTDEPVGEPGEDDTEPGPATEPPTTGTGEPAVEPGPDDQPATGPVTTATTVPVAESETTPDPSSEVATTATTAPGTDADPTAVPTSTPASDTTATAVGSTTGPPSRDGP